MTSHVVLPNTSLRVAPICLGTGEIGSSLDRDASFALLDKFVEGGGNFIDTARVYGDWVPGIERSVSEKTIGLWLKARGHRDSLVLGTKGAHWRMDAPDVPRLQPADIVTDLDGSLQDLQTDRIDLYWLHRDDPNTPVSVILDTLHREQQKGKIRYYGASNWQTLRLKAAQDYAAAQGYAGFVADQVLWNAAILANYPYGDFTVGFMDETRFLYHEKTGLAAIPFQTQAYGLFHRMQNGTIEQMNPGFRGFYRLPETTRRYERMRQVMQETGLSLTQIVLGYLTGQPFVTVPIVGCRSVPQIEDSLTALNVRLTPEQIRWIAWG